MSLMIVNDPQMATRLDQADGSVQLCTLDGKLLGYFSPVKPKMIQLEPPVSNEELRHRESKPGRPLADILHDLEKEG